MTSMDAYVTETLWAALEEARSVAPNAYIAVSPRFGPSPEDEYLLARFYVCCDDAFRERAANAVAALRGLGAGAVAVLDEVIQEAGRVLDLGPSGTAGVRVFVGDDDNGGILFSLDVPNSPGCGLHPREESRSCATCGRMEVVADDDGPVWGVTAGSVSELLALMHEKGPTWRGEVRPEWKDFMQGDKLLEAN